MEESKAAAPDGVADGTVDGSAVGSEEGAPVGNEVRPTKDVVEVEETEQAEMFYLKNLNESLKIEKEKDKQDKMELAQALEGKTTTASNGTNQPTPIPISPFIHSTHR